MENIPGVVFLIGPPGSGKTTLATAIAEQHTHIYISPGEWLRSLRDDKSELGVYIRNNYNYESLAPLVTETVHHEVGMAIQQQRRIVVEGFPRTVSQAQALPEICRNTPFIIISLTNLAIHTCFARSSIRDQSTNYNDIRFRVKVWEKMYSVMKKHIDGWIVEVDASMDAPMVEQLANEIVTYTGVVKPVYDNGPVDSPMKLATCFETAVVITQALQWSEATRLRRRFPGTHPASLERKHIAHIRQYPYVASIKADGVRYLMLISNGRLWFLERSLRVYYKQWSQSLNDYHGTLLDVEIIGETCMILDVLAVAGINVMKEGILQRIKYGYSVLDTIRPFFTHGVTVQRYCNIADLQILMKSTPASRRTDGIVFTPKSLPYRHGMDRNLFKWKPAERNTIDFLFRDGCLWVSNDDGNGYIQYGNLENAEGYIQDDIMECLMVGDLLFRAQKRRTDKKEPNAFWVAERIAKSIKDDVKLEEIISLNQSQTDGTGQRGGF